MDWDKLRVFHAVAEAGSFTHAGESLNLSQSAVSRQISALEENLKVPLFHRHARGLILTEQGELLYRTAHDVFARLAMTEAQLSESREEASGPLKVTTTFGFGTLWLTPRIREFLELYPDIRFSLVLDDGELDLSMREADVAIRLAPPRQPDLVQRHLMSFRHKIYATREYLLRHGTPTAPEELDSHRIIVFGNESKLPIGDVNWLLSVGAKPGAERKPVLEVNSVYGLFRAAQSGLGIAALPDYIDFEAGNLVAIMPDIHGPKVDTYFVYPEELRQSKRIAVFRDYLLKKMGEQEVRNAVTQTPRERKTS